jgi:uncharacterized protein (DUF2164 family)
MSIKLIKDKEVQLIKSIKHYFEENMESEIGDLKSSLLLDYFIKEIGPSIYNQAILDAQTVMTDKVNDLDSTCYQPEFMYWKK